MSVDPISAVVTAASIIPAYQIWRWWNGARVCIYGPGFSGKSTFIKYLIKGLLPPREEKTKMTMEFEKSTMFEIQYSTELGGRTLVLRYAEDSPGQSDPSLFVENMLRERPHFIFFVFDISKEFQIAGTRYDGALDWLDAFISQLQGQSHRTGKVRRNLKGLGIILNKCDKLSNNQYIKRKYLVETMVAENFREKVQPHLGCGDDNTEYFYCTLIEHAQFPDPEMRSEHKEALRFMFRQLPL